MSELKPYKIPGTGETVHIRKTISFSMLVMDMARENPKPPAPLQEITLAGQTMAERNYADPDWQARVVDWNNTIMMQAGLLLIETSVVVNMTDERKDAVKTLRKTMGGRLPLAQSDKMVWLKYIAIANDDDLTALMDAVKGNSQPTDSAVQETAESFQGDAQRA